MKKNNKNTFLYLKKKKSDIDVKLIPNRAKNIDTQFMIPEEVISFSLEINPLKMYFFLLKVLISIFILPFQAK